MLPTLICAADRYKAIFGTITPKPESNANAPKLHLIPLKSVFEIIAKASSKMLEMLDCQNKTQIGLSIVCRIILIIEKDRPKVTPRYSMLTQAITFLNISNALQSIHCTKAHLITIG